MATNALAGCFDEGSSDGSVTDDPATFTLPFPHPPENVQLNPWGGQYPTTISRVFFEPLSLIEPSGDRTLTGVIDDVSIDGPTATVRYASAFEWWNGEPVSARDRWVDERIQQTVQSVATEPTITQPVIDGAAAVPQSRSSGGTEVEDVSLLDDHTIRYEFERPLSRDIVLDRTVGQHHLVAAWRFEEYVERLDEATTDPEREDVIDDLRGDRITLEDALDDGYGCSPFRLVEVSVNRLILELNDDHPHAADIDLPALWLPVAGQQQASGLIEEGMIDGGPGALDEHAVDPASHLEQLARYATHMGVKLLCNWNNRHLARRHVRRAIRTAIPLDEFVSMGGFGEPIAVPCGLADPARETWLSATLSDGLYRYPLERDTDLAAQFMETGGYSRSDDQWTTDDGEVAAFRIRAPITTAWSGAVERITDELDDFGFEVDFGEVENTTYTADIYEGRFDLAPWWFDGRPHRAYDVNDTQPTTLGTRLTEQSERRRYGKQPEVTAPREPGDIEGETATRDAFDLVESWRQLSDKGVTGDREQIIARFAIWWNADLPDIDLATGRNGVWGNTRDFRWPDADDPVYRRAGPTGRPELDLIANGAIAPRSE